MSEQPDRTPTAASPRGSEPMPTYGLNDDYPEMWEAAQQYDFAERLGGSSSKLLAEIDEAMRELWDARRVRIEGREGMLTVYDSLGQYAGCIGSETWERLLAQEADSGS